MKNLKRLRTYSRPIRMQGVRGYGSMQRCPDGGVRAQPSSG